MDKNLIISEIRRIAKTNDGVAPGKIAFFNESGIKESDWSGKLWAKWSDAIIEAGFTPQEMQGSFTDEQKLIRLVEVIRYYDKWPTTAEIKLYARNTEGFPSHNTISSLGALSDRKLMVYEYCKECGQDFADVIELLPEPAPSNKRSKAKPKKRQQTESIIGYVYLMKSGKYHKIGRSVCAEKRAYELAIQLPEKLKLVHKIATDDPSGIEAYWHNRFKVKRMNGEWFNLDRGDINAFKRRSYM